MKTGSIWRGAFTDENGQGDIAYISLGMIALAVLGPVLVMTIMSVVSTLRCTPDRVVTKEGSKESVTVISCPYDPQPLGLAIGAACVGFATALGALAGYMLATRKPAGQSSTTTTHVQETIVAAGPTAGEPMQVEVANKEPVPVIETKPKPKGKR